MLSLIVLAGAVAVSASNCLDVLSVTLGATRPTLLVGEPARIEVTWSAFRFIEIDVERLSFVVSRAGAGAGWAEALKPRRAAFRLTLRPGEQRRTVHALSVSDGGISDGPGIMDSRRYRFLFPRPGRVGVAARYQSCGFITDWLPLDVVAPSGKDAELLQTIRHAPEIVGEFVRPAGITRLPSLFDQYPRSPHLGHAKLLFRERQLRDGGDAPEVLEALANDDLGDSPFEEDRLLLLAALTARYRTREEALPLWRRIVAEYPNGSAADEALRQMGLTNR